MRKRIKILLILILLIGTIQLTADTIIDSVYADPVLDGYIMFRQSIQSFMINTWMYGMGTGDLGVSMIEPDPNSRMRSYISFELPQIPDGYEIDSVYVRLYQYYCLGNDVENVFPIWNVPGGDTMFCIMDHIDYGDELDVSDWTKGDPGDSGTLHTNIGIISDSGEDGYRYLDITDYVLDDYNNSREKTQYRIRFPIETDWDYLGDLTNFLTSFNDPEHDPLIVLYFKYDNSIDDEVVYDAPCISVYPNPFSHSLTISFSIPYGYLENRKIEIYNVQGQLIRELDIGNENEIKWDGRDRYGNVVCNGLYLIKISARGGSSFGGESKDVNFIKRVLKLQ